MRSGAFLWLFSLKNLSAWRVAMRKVQLFVTGEPGKCTVRCKERGHGFCCAESLVLTRHCRSEIEYVASSRAFALPREQPDLDIVTTENLDESSSNLYRRKQKADGKILSGEIAGKQVEQGGLA